MKKIVYRLTALLAVVTVTMKASADILSTDTLSTDTALWYNQTQQLSGIVVKGAQPIFPVHAV